MVYEQPFDEENRVVSDCQTADISHHFTFTCVSPERNPPFSYYFFPPPPLFFLFAFFPLKYSPPSLVFFFLHFFFSCLDFHRPLSSSSSKFGSRSYRGTIENTTPRFLLSPFLAKKRYRHEQKFRDKLKELNQHTHSKYNSISPYRIMLHADFTP